MKTIFKWLGICGITIISVIAFILPSNPFIIIPSYSLMGFDKPLWLCIIVGGSFIYLLILYSIYDRITQKKSSISKIHYSSSKSSNNNLM